MVVNDWFVRPKHTTGDPMNYVDDKLKCHKLVVV